MVFLKALSLLTGFFVTQFSWTEERTPVVVELYTSQGCSSCPAADKYLGELSKSPSIISLACHVTYWNYLGWRDSLSLDYCDARQGFYRDRLKKRGSYTPQIVINGIYDAVGSQRQKIAPLLRKTGNEFYSQSPSISVGHQSIKIEFQNLTNPQDFRIDLLGIGDTHTEKITRGENEGRTIAYTNPVIQFYTLDRKKFKHQHVEVDVNKIQGSQPLSKVKTWLVLVNDSATGKLMGASKARAFNIKDKEKK